MVYAVPLRSTQTSTNSDGRQLNLRAVLQAVSAAGSMSRADIARLTGLTPPTASSLVTELLEESLLIDLGPGESIGGKRPRLLGINPEGRCLIALDVSHQPFNGRVVDLSGEVRATITTDASDVTGDAALDVVRGTIRQLIGCATAPVAGIGIATPGLVRPEGIVAEASNLGWRELNLGGTLASEFGFPVWIANDADAAALAEFRKLPPDEDSIVVVKVGRGIGAGMVLGGLPYIGSRAAAGEIGHLQVVTDGFACACGSSGCLETVSSTTSIVRDLLADDEAHTASADVGSMGRGQEQADLSRLYKTLDPAVCTAVLARAGRALGSVLAHLVAIVDVGRILITTELGAGEDRFVAAAAAEVEARLSMTVARHVDVRPSYDADEVVLTGASVLALTRALGMVWR
jgi:predicted NBD/HSP70 family sugar kinase